MSGLMSASAGEGEVVPVRPPGAADRAAAKASVSLPDMEYGSTTDAVVKALREEILSGRLAPNTWIREQTIAKRFAVSRTPVREAMRILSDEGLTIRSANQGTVVSPMSFDDILAVYAVRETLEGLAARTAALRRPSGLVERLTDVQNRMESASTDTTELAKLSLQFHALLREASDNTYLQRFLVQVEYAVRRFARTTFDVPGRVKEALDEHHAIIAAISAGDADEAEARAIEHMRRAREVRFAQMFRR